MGDNRWYRIEDLFHRAADLAPGERESFLDSTCGDDRDLRQKVKALLAADRDPEAVLEAAVAGAAGQFRAGPEENAVLIGKRIGPYSIVSLIGKGGMGAVYRAIRDGEFRMEVALKLLKRGTDTEAAVSRFRKERQILAALQHPNIARLLDGGSTDDGLPYFAMEYVEGRPLLEYAAPLSVRQRLELFRSVCAAVQYAHQNLIVHRDLKPGNILVTANGTPKLLDFGIAKLVDPDSADSNLTLTMAGSRLMTPHYASPEQVRGDPVTTASDVYSLGVVLYELLTGERPHRLVTYSPEAIERAICREEPRKPSAWNPQLDPDLDNIVFMALRKEPQRRYASAEQLSEDVRLHLEGRPVRARKDTVGYRATKFIRRNKLGVGAAALAVIGLAAGVLAVNRQARRAEYRFQQVRKLARTVLFDLNPEIENLAGSTKARELLVKTSRDYLDSLAVEAGDDRALLLELATAYEKVGDVEGSSMVSNLGNRKVSLESYGKAQAIARKLGTSKVALELLARSYQKIGIEQYWGLSRSSEGRENLHLAVQVADSIPAKTGDPAYRLRAETYGWLGNVDEFLDPVRAREPLRRSLEIAREWAAAQPGSESRSFLAIAMSRWGLVLQRTGDLTGALDSMRGGLRITEQLLEEHPENAVWRRDQGIFWEQIGNVTGHPQQFNLGDQKAAAGWLQRFADDSERLSAADPNNLRARFDLSEATAELAAVHRESDPERAEQLYRRSLALNGSFLDSNPEDWQALYWQSFNRVGLAWVLRRLGKPDGALAQLQKAVEILEGLAKRDPGSAGTRQLLGVALNTQAKHRLEMGDTLRAEQDVDRALGLLEPLYQKNPRNLMILADLADCYQGFGDLAASHSGWKQAQLEYQKSLDLWERWKQVGTSSAFDRQRRDVAAGLVARAAKESSKNSPPR
jgi:tetratricopeptide (TPR) repeat protein/predicted Ser/Thr protein kinase